MTLCSTISRLLMGLSLLLLTTVASAAEPASPAQSPQVDETVRQLETVEVIAKITGPGLWQIRNGDKVLWILGTQSPLPRRFEWESDELVERLGESQLLIAPPTVKFEGVGAVRGLFLLPSLLKARRDPEGRSLEESVGPELYAQWQVLKQRYFPRKRKTDTWRPMIAALELYSEAIEDARMTGSGPVWKAVRKSARRLRLPIEEPAITLRIDDPRGAIRSFAENRLDDMACFRLTIERLESDITLMRERAEAWAVGDVAGLRALPLSDQNEACREAFLQAAVSKEQGFDNLPERVRDAWLQTAQKALAEHRSSVAVLPISVLIDPSTGVLAELRELGFEVIEPE